MNYPVLHSAIVEFGPYTLHAFDKAFELGPIALRWYGLAYLSGFVGAWWLGMRRARRLAGWSEQQVADLIFYAALGVILGGRFGYMLFYGLDNALRDPLWIVKIWTGGMSSHGGMIGVIFALWLFARHTNKRLLEVGDFVAPLVPAGLLFGRLANFVNTELPGRVTDVPWGLHYPCWAVRALSANCGDGYEAVARHPSPLYQAAAEGLVLGLLIWLFLRKPRPTATVSGLFLLGYGVLRLITESFRQPDADLGFALAGVITRGQLLSAPMVIGGIGLILWGVLRETPPAQRSVEDEAPVNALGAAPGRMTSQADKARRRANKLTKGRTPNRVRKPTP